MKIPEKLGADQLAYWADFDPKPIVMKAPPGMESCSDCVAVDTRSDGQRVVRVPWVPDDEDITNIVRGAVVWLSVWGGLPPHSVQVEQVPRQSRTEVQDHVEHELGNDTVNPVSMEVRACSSIEGRPLAEPVMVIDFNGRSANTGGPARASVMLSLENLRGTIVTLTAHADAAEDLFRELRHER